MGKRKHGGEGSGKRKAPKWVDVRMHSTMSCVSMYFDDIFLHACSFLRPKDFQKVAKGYLLAVCQVERNRVSGKPLIF